MTRPTSNSPKWRADSAHLELHFVGSKYAQIAAIFAGLILVGAACLTNATYALKRAGDDQMMALILVAVAVAVSIILALSLTAAIRALGSRQLITAATCFAAFGLCAAFSISAALGSQSSVRVEAASAVAERDAARVRAQQALDRATAVLAALPASRPAGQVESDLSRLSMNLPADVDCGGWVSDKRRRTLCVERHGLEGELAIAERRVGLEDAAKDAREALDRLSGAGPSQANADAATIARFLLAAGYDVSPDRVGDWLTILAVALLELGGGLAFAVAGALRPSQPFHCSLQSKRAGGDGAQGAAPVSAVAADQAGRWGVPAIAAVNVSPKSVKSADAVPAAPAEAVRKSPRKLSQPSSVLYKPGRQKRVRPESCASQQLAADKIIRLVSASPDGTFRDGSVRGLAKLIDASRSTTHRALVGLVSAGVLAHAGDAIVLAAGRAAA